MKKSFLLVFFVILTAVLLMTGAAFADDSEQITVDNGLPVVYVTVDESEGHHTIEEMNASEDHSVTCDGTVKIVVPEGFRYSDMDADQVCESTTDLAMTIRGRGNSTWDDNKKPYKIKLDKKADLFGLGKNKHWVLIANAFDPSLLRDRITAWLGNNFGFEFTPTGYPVDLVMNGKYLGSYYFSENVRVDDNRLEIDELTEDITDPDSEEITGGYLLQNPLQTRDGSPDIFMTKNGERWATNTPTFDLEDDGYENPAQQQYIQNHIQKLDDALFGENYRNEDGQHYRDLMDIESAAKYWLINEASLNADAYGTGSTYIYKKRGDDKIYWGPLWDFDYAWDHGDASEYFSIQGVWPKALLYDKEEGGFIDEVKKQWPALKAAIDQLTEDGGIIDKFYQETKDSKAQDVIVNPPPKHGPLGSNSDEEVAIPGADLSYEEVIANLKTWINTRSAWIDANLSKLDTLIHRLRYFVDGKLYASHFTEHSWITGAYNYPEKNDMVFIGWTDENGNMIDTDEECSTDLDLFAKYIPEEEATHGKDILLKTTCNEVMFDPEAPNYNIMYAVIPSDAQDKKVTWTSSDESVATVDNKGVVTMKCPGKVTLTGTLKYGKSKKFYLTVLEGNNYTIPTSIAPAKSVMYLTVGQESYCTIMPEPYPAKTDNCSYESENENVVSIDWDGVFKANAPGRTKVRVSMSIFDENWESLADLETYVTVNVQDKGVTRKSIKDAKVTGLSSRAYSGKAIKPSVKVKLGGKTLKKGTDYTLTYSNNKKVGKASVKITGIGNYKGSKTVHFKIIPKTTSIKALNPVRKGFKVTWLKKTTQTTGYQVRWSLKSSMAKDTRKLIKSNKTVTFRKTKLKAGKTYYVQVRTYKTVKGMKYWSKWSAKKKVKTKR